MDRPPFQQFIERICVFSFNALFGTIRRHPLTSAFDMVLLATVVAFASIFAAIFDLAEFWSDISPEERTITLEELSALGALLAIGLGIFVWRRVLEEQQDRSRWQKAEEELHEQRTLAMADPLTELPNRRGFMAALEHIVARHGAVAAAVYLLDLNGFKQVNDQCGHDAGDEVLRAVGQRFRAAARADDVVARLGGDEFAVLAHGVRSHVEAADIGDRFIDALKSELTVNGHTYRIGVAVGVALLPEDGLAVRELLVSADMAMYRAKNINRSAHCFLNDRGQPFERSA